MDKTLIGIETATKAYIECALWSSTNDDGEPLDRNTPELSTEFMLRAYSDVARFMLNAWDIISQPDFELTIDQTAHDLWLTRNHHGAGFWDRELGEPGDRLTKIAHDMGECDIYIGDDGLAYMS